MKYDRLAINGEIFTLEQLERNNENKEEKGENTETTSKEKQGARTLSNRLPSNGVEDERPMEITRGENSKNDKEDEHCKIMEHEKNESKKQNLKEKQINMKNTGRNEDENTTTHQ
ncbi:hypothetical protein HHI36_005398 [Cryptolaemus montrouzieri]|uniref:Uncharacterized protein n=1 Tax=Cryptolaemus montrouzieri TaxID=559131 RepID=A0ABD2NUN4_9CUCU